MGHIIVQNMTQRYEKPTGLWPNDLEENGQGQEMPIMESSSEIKVR